MSENMEPTIRAVPPSRAGMPGDAEENADDPTQMRADIEVTRADMGETIDEIQGRLTPASLTASATDTVKQTALQARDTAVDKVQQMAQQVADRAAPVVDQVREKATPVVNQTMDRAKELGTEARRRYDEFQERTGIQITPRMLGIAAGVLAGTIAAIALIQRLRGRGDAEEADVVIAEIPLDELPDGKYTVARVE